MGVIKNLIKILEIMLTLTYTESGFSSNREISEKTLKNHNSNKIVRIECIPASILSEVELMDKACNYINSFIDFHVMTRYVTNSLSISNDQGINKVNELMFQIYW